MRLGVCVPMEHVVVVAVSSSVVDDILFCVHVSCVKCVWSVCVFDDDQMELFVMWSFLFCCKRLKNP